MHDRPLHIEKAHELAICIDIYSKIKDHQNSEETVLTPLEQKSTDVYKLSKSLHEMCKYTLLSCSDKALDIRSMTNLEIKQ